MGKSSEPKPKKLTKSTRAWVWGGGWPDLCVRKKVRRGKSGIGAKTFNIDSPSFGVLSLDSVATVSLGLLDGFQVV